jgi:photosystem II stability/assembly factor-like uncharacterized protein
MSDNQNVNSGEIAPDVVRRLCGGYLAISPKGALFSIGTTGATAEEARDRFCLATRRWLEILATGMKT